MYEDEEIRLLQELKLLVNLICEKGTEKSTNYVYK
jgi:hypothetical protein